MFRGQRNQYLVEVILNKKRGGNFKRLIQAVREELEKWANLMPVQEKGRIDQMLDFISDGARVRG